ncbi:cell division protein ZapA [Ahniella affigens]|uniref:Cell division protein ZapA n=1 Tax=Ahniella affigens TaxID=2021234 RepID=A0A2P1PYA0_9GAMM|nr:cell division protein ZapA [Ahniella affigens]AVP99803.1 cell division protein ZapA [Ahniella affigens]
MSADPISVHILDRDYLVACAPEERAGLIEAARLLDGRMRDLRQASRSAPADRLAVMAALNLAHELLQVRESQKSGDHALNQDLSQLRFKLDAALNGLAKLG